jgi:hypothetical protein
MVKLHNALLFLTFKVSTAHLGVSLGYTLHYVKSVVEHLCLMVYNYSRNMLPIRK